MKITGEKNKPLSGKTNKLTTVHVAESGLRECFSLRVTVLSYKRHKARQQMGRDPRQNTGATLSNASASSLSNVPLLQNCFLKEENPSTERTPLTHASGRLCFIPHLDFLSFLRCDYGNISPVRPILALESVQTGVQYMWKVNTGSTGHHMYGATHRPPTLLFDRPGDDLGLCLRAVRWLAPRFAGLSSPSDPQQPALPEAEAAAAADTVAASATEVTSSGTALFPAATSHEGPERTRPATPEAQDEEPLQLLLELGAGHLGAGVDGIHKSLSLMAGALDGGGGGEQGGGLKSMRLRRAFASSLRAHLATVQVDSVFRFDAPRSLAAAGGGGGGGGNMLSPGRLALPPMLNWASFRKYTATMWVRLDPAGGGGAATLFRFRNGEGVGVEATLSAAGPPTGSAATSGGGGKVQQQLQGRREIVVTSFQRSSKGFSARCKFGPPAEVVQLGVTGQGVRQGGWRFVAVSHGQPYVKRSGRLRVSVDGDVVLDTELPYPAVTGQGSKDPMSRCGVRQAVPVHKFAVKCGYFLLRCLVGGSFRCVAFVLGYVQVFRVCRGCVPSVVEVRLLSLLEKKQQPTTTTNHNNNGSIDDILLNNGACDVIPLSSDRYTPVRYHSLFSPGVTQQEGEHWNSHFVFFQDNSDKTKKDSENNNNNRTRQQRRQQQVLLLRGSGRRGGSARPLRRRARHARGQGPAGGRPEPPRGRSAPPRRHVRHLAASAAHPGITWALFHVRFVAEDVWCDWRRRPISVFVLVGVMRGVWRARGQKDASRRFGTMSRVPGVLRYL